jgi:uncharacterized tellurite resistance protein B-like protein
MPTLGEKNMADIEKLNDREKIFLAGCIESMMLADGSSSESEISGLNKIVREDFPEFDKKLAEFDEKVKDDEAFWEMAKGITTTGSQDIILEVVEGLALRDGLVKSNENELLDRLKDLWA